MTHETFFFKAPKFSVANIFPEAVALVRTRYPTAMAEGSVGHYSFRVDNEIVAEAWLKVRGEGWWLKVVNLREQDAENIV